MIGYLTGVVHSKSGSQIILLLNGVGYSVTVGAKRWESLKIGEPVELYIYPHVREDSFDLYGFARPAELELYKLILTVPGIGPKTALAVIDQGAERAQKAVAEADIEFFTSVPRLGKKNAQKIIIELKNKLGGLKEMELTRDSEDNLQAVEALRGMGYTRGEALKAVEQVPKEVKFLEEKIGQALRLLGQNKIKASHE